MYVATKGERRQQQQMLGALQLMSSRMMPSNMAISAPSRMSLPAIMPAARPVALTPQRSALTVSPVQTANRQYGAAQARAEEDRKAAILAAQPRSAHNVARDEAKNLYKALMDQGQSSASAIAIMAQQGKRLMTF